MLAEVARRVNRVESRVHMLESITRPQAKERINAIFKTDVRIAAVLWLDTSNSQEELAKLVSKSIGRRIGQVAIGKHLRRLKSLGVLGQDRSRTFFVEESWKEAGLESQLREKAKKMRIKVAPKRRESSR